MPRTTKSGKDKGVLPTERGSNPTGSHIFATSRQSRFHLETLESQTEIDLKTVNISIGDLEILVDADLKLKAGVRYALIGRNGTGKSTILQAIAKKLIPGLGQTIRVLLLSQIEDSAETIGNPEIPSGSISHESKLEEENTYGITALEHVIRGDTARLKLIQESKELSDAIESGSLRQLHKVMLKRKLQVAQHALYLADDLAKLRSGAKGKAARAELVKAEESERVAKENYDNAEESEPPVDVTNEALVDLTTSQLSLDAMEAIKTPKEATQILAGLGFTQKMMNSPFSSLSGGWRSRCSLAISLLIQSDVLLLDEPSNYLDLEATLWLESHLKSQDRTIVITSHDQSFLENVVQETIQLRHKALRYYDGTPKQWEIDERKKRRRQLKTSQAMDKKREHIEKSIEMGKASAKKSGDENRLRMVKSRQKKLDERWGVEQSAKGGRFKLNRDLAGYYLTSRAAIEIEEGEPPIKIQIPDPPPLRILGDLVHFENVTYRWPNAEKRILEGATFTLQQGGRMSFVGQNGQGKSTLAMLIMGGIKPTTGHIKIHPGVRIGYFSQHSVEELTPARTDSNRVTALRYFIERMNAMGEEATEQDARACLGSFGLPGKLASETAIEHLSGGQKVRLALAIVVYPQPHLLLLDEVTTHVDAATIQALGMALRHYQGGLILVTHDRWFNKVVIEGESPRAKSEIGGINQDDDETESESSADEDELEEMGGRREGKRAKKKGKTYQVNNGKVRLMEQGMDGYVKSVEKKMEKRAKEQAIG